MTRIAILSDTHVPSRADRIPSWVRTEIEAAEYTIHAGDFDSRSALEVVSEAAGSSMVAVAGNMDPTTLDLPAIATLDVDAVRFVVTHGTGPPGTYDDRVVRTAEERAGGETTVAVAGHTHTVIDTTLSDIRVLNPGSATAASPAQVATMMRVDVEDGDIEVEVLER